MSPCSNTFWFLRNSRIVFPAPTLARKSFASKLVISWLSHRSLLWLDERHLTSSARACNIFVCCSIEAHRLSHDTGHLCQKSGMSDRHGRSLWAGQSFNVGTELLRERLDDARAEPRFLVEQRHRPASQLHCQRSKASNLFQKLHTQR